jgi:hypothetical protein
MNHQDKQLTSFLGMTIGSALDDYMANLAQQIAKSNKQEETTNRNVKELEAVLATYQQRLPIVEQKTYQLEKELKETKATLASMVAKETQVDTPKPEQPVIKHFMEWQEIGIKVSAANKELQWAAILDQFKRLMWAVNASKIDSFPHPTKLLSWQQAQEWVKQVNAKGWCGYHDWRLPTSDELSLIWSLKAKDDFLLNDIFTIQNDIAVNNTYWTSTIKHSSGIQHPHVVNCRLEFSYTASPNDFYHTRLVRSV